MIRTTAEIGNKLEKNNLTSVNGYYSVTKFENGEQTSYQYMTERNILNNLSLGSFTSKLKSSPSVNESGYYPFYYKERTGNAINNAKLPFVPRYAGIFEEDKRYLYFTSTGDIKLEDAIDGRIENVIGVSPAFAGVTTAASVIPVTNSKDEIDSWLEHRRYPYCSLFNYTVLQPDGTYHYLRYTFEFFVRIEATELYPLNNPNLSYQLIVHLDANKILETLYTGYTLELDIYQINSLRIDFDTINNNHPSHLIIKTPSNTEYTLNLTSAQATITNLSNEEGILRVTIPDWTNSSSYLVISKLFYLSDNVFIEINKNNIISLNTTIDITDKTDVPSWGIISSTGNLSYKDIDGKTLFYVESNLLKRGLPCKMFINNSLIKDKKQHITTKYVSKVEYDSDNFIANISLKDDLEEWQDITVKGLNYDPLNKRTSSAKHYYTYLYNNTPQKYLMYSFDELDNRTSNALETIIFNYLILYDGTLWQQWEKLCELCGACIYKDSNGKTAFKKM